MPQLACTLYQHEGGPIRFGPDEADAGDVPSKVSFGSEVPGWGWAEGSVVLKRPAQLSDLDPNLFASCHIYDEAGETVYQGRVAGIPRTGANEIELDLQGPLAHLDDDTSARMIYRDTDLGSWQGMSRQRRLDLLGGSFAGVGDGESSYDSTSPALNLSAEANWVAAASPSVESWYDAGPGLLVSKIAGNWSRTAATTSTSWQWQAFVADDDVGTNSSGSGDLQSEPTATAAFSFSPTTARRWALLQFLWGAGTAVSSLDGTVFLVSFTNLAVYGSHGLTVRGSEPSAGFYASDVVSDALSRWAPLIDVAPNGIEQASFVIPHLAFRDNGNTARNVIEAVSLFGASGFASPDWGYYEDGFFWKTPGTYGRTWRVRRDQAAIPQDEGPSNESRCNGYLVTYTDANGKSRSVGPPGSGADYETTDLQDTDPTNPVNAAGIPRRYGSRDIGITSRDGAVLIGRLLLADANTRPYKGSVQISGKAADSAGNDYPTYMVRAGDYIVVEDDEDTTPRKVVSTTFEGETVTAELDNKSTSIDTLLSRLDVAIKPAGF